MKLNSFVRKVLNDASLHLFLIVSIGFIIYSKTFNVPFHFDDINNIVENYKLRDLNNFWPPEGSRWFGFLTFALNYHLGGLNITGYHVVNLVIHIFNAILVYWLVVLTLRIQDFNPPKSPFSKGGLRGLCMHRASWIMHHHLIALFSALLFVSHPIQTQAVTYIVQRFTSLATMFYLLSLVMYIKFRIQDTRYAMHDSGYKIQDVNRESFIMHHGSGHATRYTLYAISLISAILAMKTKEISFTLPFIIILYEFCFFKSQDSDPESSSGRTMNLRRLLYLMPFLLTLLIIPLSLISIDKPVGDAIGELKGYTAETTAINRWSYLFTQFRVIVTYIRLLFFPINQNVDYDYPIYHSFLNPNVFLSFLFLLSIFGLAIYLLYCSRSQVYGSLACHPEPKAKGLRDSSATPQTCPDRDSSVASLLQNDTKRRDDIKGPIRYPLHPTRLIAFGIFWFFITLSVESSIIPIKDVSFEHRLYLPSVGAIVAFSSAVFHVLHLITRRTLNYELRTMNSQAKACSYASRLTPHNSRFSLTTVYLLLSAVILAFSITTYQRNTVWQDEMSLWGDVVRKSPLKARGYTNLGAAYGKTGATNEAIKRFNIALILMPDDAEVHSDIGAAYGSKGWTDMAIEHLQTALKLKPDLVSAHNNIGLVYKSKGLIDKAIEHFQIAIKLKPEFADAHNNLGNAYYKKGQFDDAIREYQTALTLKPDDTESQYNLSLVYAIKSAIEGDKGRLKGN